MSVLMRATEIIKRPVVTFSGDDIAQVKDIVYVGTGGSVGGFTLAGRGLFSGPLKEALPWDAVHALGPDAVMVRDEDALGSVEGVVSRADAKGGDVLGSRVITDAGVELGSVSDVILDVGQVADVVGYEIDPTEALDTGTKKVLIPSPDTIAVSGEALMLPASARNFVRNDLAGFGAAVLEFRAQLEGASEPAAPSSQPADPSVPAAPSAPVATGATEIRRIGGTDK